MLVHEKVINETLEGLLLELKEECENYIKLMNQLELENLTKEQIEEVLGEIMASVVSLEVHSEHAKEELYNWNQRFGKMVVPGTLKNTCKLLGI